MYEHDVWPSQEGMSPTRRVVCPKSSCATSASATPPRLHSRPRGWSALLLAAFEQPLARLRALPGPVEHQHGIFSESSIRTVIIFHYTSAIKILRTPSIIAELVILTEDVTKCCLFAAGGGARDYGFRDVPQPWPFVWGLSVPRLWPSSSVDQHLVQSTRADRYGTSRPEIKVSQPDPQPTAKMNFHTSAQNLRTKAQPQPGQGNMQTTPHTTHTHTHTQTHTHAHRHARRHTHIHTRTHT
jgi:hypothetical protein